MAEARRATLALAALVATALAAVVLLTSHLPHLAGPPTAALARYCPLTGMTAGMAHGDAVPFPAWLGLGLLGGGLAVAVGRLGRALHCSRRIGRLLDAVPAEAGHSRSQARVAALSARAGLPVVPIVTDLGDRPAAFTVGLLRPRIVISTAVVDALTDAELEAILTHEAVHVRRRDPLRLVVAGFCRDLLFFLPLGHALFACVREAQERAADDAAAEAAGPLEVASALVAFLRVTGRGATSAMVPAAAGADPEARIRRLLDAPPAGPSAGARLARTGADLLVSGALVTALVAMPAGAADMSLAGCCAPALVAAALVLPAC